MKLLAAFALFVAVSADISHLGTPSHEYLSPLTDAKPTVEYLPPVHAEPSHPPIPIFAPVPAYHAPPPSAPPAPTYHAPTQQYLESQNTIPHHHHTESQQHYQGPSGTHSETHTETHTETHFPTTPEHHHAAPAEEPAPAHTFGADGYQYKNPTEPAYRRYRF